MLAAIHSRTWRPQFLVHLSVALSESLGIYPIGSSWRDPRNLKRYCWLEIHAIVWFLFFHIRKTHSHVDSSSNLYNTPILFDTDDIDNFVVANADFF